jgi:hypothetical protein
MSWTTTMQSQQHSMVDIVWQKHQKHSKSFNAKLAGGSIQPFDATDPIQRRVA